MSKEKTQNHGSGAPSIDLSEWDLPEDSKTIKSVYDKPHEKRYIKNLTPEWTHWEMMPIWSVRDAVALSLDMEPRDFQMLLQGTNGGSKLPDFLDVPAFYERLQIVQACVLHGELSVKFSGSTVIESLIVATEFIVWAIGKGFSIPERFRTFYTTATFGITG